MYISLPAFTIYGLKKLLYGEKTLKLLKFINFKF